MNLTTARRLQTASFDECLTIPEVQAELAEYRACPVAQNEMREFCHDQGREAGMEFSRMIKKLPSQVLKSNSGRNEVFEIVERYILGTSDRMRRMGHDPANVQIFEEAFRAELEL